MSNIERIKELENSNAELSKEILLNEAAIYEAEREIGEIDTELHQHPKIQKYVNNLQLLMEQINRKNQNYKNEIYENDLKISKLRKEDNENE